MVRVRPRAATTRMTATTRSMGITSIHAFGHAREFLQQAPWVCGNERSTMRKPLIHPGLSSARAGCVPFTMLGWFRLRLSGMLARRGRPCTARAGRASNPVSRTGSHRLHRIDHMAPTPPRGAHRAIRMRPTAGHDTAMGQPDHHGRHNPRRGHHRGTRTRLRPDDTSPRTAVTVLRLVILDTGFSLSINRSENIAHASLASTLPSEPSRGSAGNLHHS